MQDPLISCNHKSRSCLCNGESGVDATTTDAVRISRFIFFSLSIAIASNSALFLNSLLWSLENKPITQRDCIIMSRVDKVKWTVADAAGPTIASSVSDCLRSFEDFVFQIRHTDAEASNLIESSEVIDELGRFRVWAGNIGAHRKGLSSLDYRLRDASHIKSKVQSLLCNLDDAIQRGE